MLVKLKYVLVQPEKFNFPLREIAFFTIYNEFGSWTGTKSKKLFAAKQYLKKVLQDFEALNMQNT